MTRWGTWLVAIALGAGCATTGRDTARVEPTLARPGRRVEPAAVVPVAGQVPLVHPAAVPPPAGATAALPAGAFASAAPLHVPAAPAGAVPGYAAPLPGFAAVPGPPGFAGSTGSSFVPATAGGVFVPGAPTASAPGAVSIFAPSGGMASAAPHSFVVSGFLSGADISSLGLRLHPKPQTAATNVRPLIAPPAP